MELHGRWLQVAQALHQGAGTLRELTDALDDRSESRTRVARSVSVCVFHMRTVGLVTQDGQGLLRLTEKGCEQLMVTA